VKGNKKQKTPKTKQKQRVLFLTLYFLSFQTSMASLEEVWGSPFPKKHHNMASKHYTKEEPREPEKEGRVAPTPLHRPE